MRLRVLPPPLAIWAAAEPSPLERLEELEAEELRLLAVGPCGRLLPSRRPPAAASAKRAELSPFVTRAPARV